MIDPQEQWAIQIEVTNFCPRSCSNCTRFCGHHQEPFFMSPVQFRQCAEALWKFPLDSPPAAHVPRKVVGMLGGEPLCHPDFEILCYIMAGVIPDRRHRGLWTSMAWERSRHSRFITRMFGYVNSNRHETRCLHSPVLVGIEDVVPDAAERKRLIDNCWLQRLWSGSCTPKGFFFCEVAGAMDILFDGPGGLPIEPDCWQRPLADFQEQIDRWCPRCGVPLNLTGRRDHEEVDDISPGNLARLAESPRIKAGRYVLHETRPTEAVAEPWKYLQ